MAGQAKQRVLHAWLAVGAAQPGQHFIRAVLRPVDAARRLRHERLPDATRCSADVSSAGQRRRTQLCVSEAFHGTQHRHHSRLGDLGAVQAALARAPHFKLSVSPHRPGVEFSIGLQHRHAPLRRLRQHRPVQRRGPAVPRRAGMQHQAHNRSPNRFRDESLEKRCDQQVRLEQRTGLFGHRVRNVQFH